VPLAIAWHDLLPARPNSPSARTFAVISELHPSGSAWPVTFAPRLLSCLRIKHRVTAIPARLDTRPVAGGYRGGIHTRSNYAALPSRNVGS